MKRRPIAGSTIVVVGATSGAGRATALSLAAAGANLVVVARPGPAVHDVAEACRALGTPACAVEVDIACDADSERIVHSAVQAFGRIDTWINTASTLLVGDLERQPTHAITRLVATNIIGTTLASRAALRHFGDVGGGVLINVSSLLGLVPNPVVPTYVMSKFAIRGLTLSLHEAARGSAVRVCVVMPGPIDTPMFRHASNYSGRAIRAIAPATSPERVAATVIRSIRRPRRQRTVGAVGALIVVGHRVLPRFVEVMVAQTAARLIFRGDRFALPTPGSLHEPPDTGSSSGGWRRLRWRVSAGDAIGRALARSRQGAGTASIGREAHEMRVAALQVEHFDRETFPADGVEEVTQR